MPSPSDTGTLGRDALVDELKVINVARASARFRAFPDDTGISFKGDKPVACVRPILKLLDGHVIPGLAAGTAGEECPRDIDHVRRALALVEQRRAAPGAEASGRLRRCILEASDASSALRHAGVLAPTADIGRIRCAVRATACRGVIGCDMTPSGVRGGNDALSIYLADAGLPLWIDAHATTSTIKVVTTRRKEHIDQRDAKKRRQFRGRREFARIPNQRVRMCSVFALLRKPRNQWLLSLLGGGVVVVVSGIWAVVTYVWPAHQAPTPVCAEQGVAIRGNVSGSTVTNKVSGGTATAGPCVDSAKK